MAGLTATNKPAAQSAIACTDLFDFMNAHQKGWIAGAVWGVAEVLRTHGEEVIARDMLKGLGKLDDLRKHAEPCDIEEIEKHPWVHESNSSSATGGAQPTTTHE